MPKFRKKPLLEIEWIDASHYSGWKDAKDCKKDSPVTTRTVGFKVPSRRDCIVLAMTHNEYDDVSGREVIPRKLIKSIRRIE